ncbi:polyphosphate kinase 1 [Salinibaculum rarum]|uniref:polyphosphate kinase 1 n=1 Tax=Salinibaculum rarum TaxID=3058903 RepID=UPI0034E93973
MPDADTDLTDPSLYLNRELSELAFQQRVLHEALDERTPLLERVRFLAIFTRNMDEFIMKRVGGLKQQISAGVTERTVDGRTPREQWEDVLDEARPMFEQQIECYHETIRPALADEGIHILEYDDLTAAEREQMRTYFEENVLPTLTPLSFDPAHPFPFISNLSLSLGVLTQHHSSEEPTFTRVKIPPNRPRLVPVDDDTDEDRYVLIEDVVRSNLDLLFPSVDIVGTALFRLTRNAEVRRNEEVAEDLIDMIEEVIEQRRFGTVVRLELEQDAPDRIRQTLVEQLDLDGREVFEVRPPLDLEDFEVLTDLDRPDLKVDSWTPVAHPRLDTGGQYDGSIAPSPDSEHSVFQEINRGDILLHHPYHSFTGTVQRFLEEAAHDPDVLAIKAAIYRTASDSQVIQSLIDAADNGKQVAVMVELKARFDEQNNLEWVRTLEEQGIHVAYGTVGLKTHTKTALVVREEPDGVKTYSHVGTGNYHSKTAKGYVDLGLLSSDPDIGRDLLKVFNSFTGPALDEEFRKLLIAPVTMRERFRHFIRRETAHARAGKPARIVVKVNGLEDPDIVRLLYEASQAGVDIDLFVRDICRLRPGIDGISETVDVYSIVGRFLEHSRIFYFENGGDPEYYIGSADWMTRNLDKRVEAVTPVEDPALRDQLRFVLDVMLADNRRVWEMGSDGSYTQRRPDTGEQTIDTQAVLMREATAASEHDGVNRGIPGVTEIPDTGLRVEAETDHSSGKAGIGDTERPETASASETVTSSETVTHDSTADGAETGPEDLPAVLTAHREKWYEPDSGTYRFAVRTPDGDRVYRKTPRGAESALTRHYGDSVSENGEASEETAEQTEESGAETAVEE